MRRRLACASALSIALLGGAHSVEAAPDGSAIDAEGVALLEAAADALGDNDNDSYERAVNSAEFGEVWLPAPAIFALQDREVSDIVLWAEALDADDADLIDAAYGLVEDERDAADAISDSMTDEQIETLDDADTDAAGLLQIIDRRSIEITLEARVALQSIFANEDQVPSAAQYAEALDDLDQLYERLDSAPAPTAAPPVEQVSADPPSASDDTPATEPTPEPVAQADAPATPEPIATATPTSEPTGGTPLGLIIAIALGAAALLVGLFSMMKGRKSDQLADMAFTDGLTGLKNRRRLDADVAAQQDARDPQTASLMVDVDHFKKFNDTHGHAMGDEVLRLVGEALARECRKSDVPYRYGGEEFCVLMNNTTPEQAAAAGERLRAAIEAIELPIPERITASIGVSIGAPDELSNTIKQADAALYDAKESGRNCVAIA